MDLRLVLRLVPPGRFLAASLCLALLPLAGACSSPAAKAKEKAAPLPEPPPPASEHQAVNPLSDEREEATDGIRTWGVMGTIDRRDTEVGLRSYLPAVAACFERQVKKQPYLGGSMLLDFRLDPGGQVKRLVLSQSSVGSLPVERCVLGELSRARFPPPRGGEAEFHFPLTFKGDLSPRLWSPGRVRRRIESMQERLDHRQPPPGGLVLTFYVNRAGKVVSVGMSADEPIDEQVADDLARQISRLRFGRQRMRFAKVSYSF